MCASLKNRFSPAAMFQAGRSPTIGKPSPGNISRCSKDPLKMFFSFCTFPSSVSLDMSSQAYKFKAESGEQSSAWDICWQAVKSSYGLFLSLARDLSVDERSGSSEVANPQNCLAVFYTVPFSFFSKSLKRDKDSSLRRVTPLRSSSLMPLVASSTSLSRYERSWGRNTISSYCFKTSFKNRESALAAIRYSERRGFLLPSKTEESWWSIKTSTTSPLLKCSSTAVKIHSKPLLGRTTDLSRQIPPLQTIRQSLVRQAHMASLRLSSLELSLRICLRAIKYSWKTSVSKKSWRLLLLTTLKLKS